MKLSIKALENIILATSTKSNSCEILDVRCGSLPTSFKFVEWDEEDKSPYRVGEVLLFQTMLGGVMRFALRDCFDVGNFNVIMIEAWTDIVKNWPKSAAVDVQEVRQKWGFEIGGLLRCALRANTQNV